MQTQKYDIIGDIHGCAEQLEKLLIKLGYTNEEGLYSHPEHQIIFLGDFIDRGPDQKGVLDIVRPMIEAGHALAVMGNHEFNAICYATEINGEYIRPHNDKNNKQHKAFLEEYPLGSPEHADVIEWFKTLPPYLDLGDIGVVHACWDETSFPAIVPFLNPDHTLTQEAYTEFANKDSDIYAALESILKGPELDLPPGVYFHDKDGNKRERARIKWWDASENSVSERLQLGASAEFSSAQKEILNSMSLTDAFNKPAKPVFVGHYWMKGTPEALAERVACVDYSVARGGKMTAYQWRGEDVIHDAHFTWV